MAQVDESSNGRSSNFELNLVPFIDLMSVLITFLLITAVWTQISMIQLGSSIYSKRNSDQITPPPEMADLPLRVDVKEGGYQLVVGNDRSFIAKNAAGYNVEELLKKLSVVKQTYPAKSDAVVTVADKLPYQDLITGMDVIMRAGFVSISISTGEAQ